RGTRIEALLELLGEGGPELSQVEIACDVRAFEFPDDLDRVDPSHPVRGRRVAASRDQVPLAGFEDQSQWLDGALDLAPSPLLVADSQDLVEFGRGHVCTPVT